MARGKRIEKEYTGKALETYNRIQELTIELKAAREQLKEDYKEQLRLEKEAEQQRKEAEREEVVKLFEESGLSLEDLKGLINKQ